MSLNVLITGVTRGIGRAMVDGFIEHGANVFGCGRSEESISKLQAEYPAQHFIVADVSDDAAIGAWKSQLTDVEIDLLINNAALINANAELWNVPAQEFSDVIDVNVKGTFYVLRHFLPDMIARRRGVIVNFSSGWGRSTSPEVGPYCATKWAIEGLTKSLAQELPAGMAAVALSPGVVNTEMLQSCFASGASDCISPAEWAVEAIPMLLGLDETVNGESLTVGG